MKNQTLAITIFIFTILSVSIASGYQYVGDIFERVAHSANVLNSYFVLVALFAIYKGQALFTQAQLRFLAYFTITLTVVCYLYPVLKYWEQDSRDFLSTFIYDLILNGFIVTVLIKESKRECSNVNC